MKGIRIKKLYDKDINEIIDIWYEGSKAAHNFIPDHYWKENKLLMKEKYIPMSETYTATDGKVHFGFVSMIDEYLAALFVRTDSQGMGIGSALLEYVKQNREKIQLKVYMKNEKSIKFYKSKGFRIISESIDSGTGEAEFVMEWEK